MAVTARLAPAVFIDKDGTLVQDVPYNADPARIVLVPEAGRALRLLRQQGCLLAVVTNQAGVARGLFAEGALRPVRARLEALLREEGVELAGFRYCPHDPDGLVARYAVRCACRKPQPGMLLDAARELNVDLARSWMVGDLLDDAEAGWRAGCRTILLDNGHETEWRPGPGRQPDHVVRDLLAAAHVIAGRHGAG